MCEGLDQWFLTGGTPPLGGASPYALCTMDSSTNLPMIILRFYNLLEVMGLKQRTFTWGRRCTEEVKNHWFRRWHPNPWSSYV